MSLLPLSLICPFCGLTPKQVFVPAAGTPLAINYQGWQAELLNRTGAGIVLPPDNVPEAAEKLVAFLHDKARMEEAGCAGRQLAVEQFSRDMAAVQMEQVLLRAATRGS